MQQQSALPIPAKKVTKKAPPTESKTAKKVTKKRSKSPPAPKETSSKRAKQLLKTESDRQAFGEIAKNSNCVICLDSDCNQVALCCMSSFHIHCLAQWLEKGNDSCPACRAHIHWELEKVARPVGFPGGMNPFFLNMLRQSLEHYPDSDDDDDDGGRYYCENCDDYHYP